MLFRSELEKAEATIVGFHSTKHRGIFTPGDSNIHVHFRTPANTKSGHIQKLQLGDARLTAKRVTPNVRLGSSVLKTSTSGPLCPQKAGIASLPRVADHLAAIGEQRNPAADAKGRGISDLVRIPEADRVALRPAFKRPRRSLLYSYEQAARFPHQFSNVRAFRNSLTSITAMLKRVLVASRGA